MKSLLLLTASGPLLILTSHESLRDHPGYLLLAIRFFNSRHRDFADILRELVATLHRRPTHDRQIPALHVRVLGKVDRLPFEARDPRPDRDIGD
jgi:hypothetical protein